jgi:hypothetical protein
LEYDDARVAEAVADAISPDNFKTPSDLLIRTGRENRRVVTQIECQGKLLTLVATIDDLLSCASTAEKAVRTAMKFE